MSMLTQVFIGGTHTNKEPVIVNIANITRPVPAIQVSVSGPNYKTATVTRPSCSSMLTDYKLFGTVDSSLPIKFSSEARIKLVANVTNIFTGLNSKSIDNWHVIEYNYYHKPGSDLYVGVVMSDGVRIDETPLLPEFLSIIRPEYLMHSIVINPEQRDLIGLNIEWIEGKTSAVISAGYGHEQAITTGNYIMDVTADVDDGVAVFYPIVYNNNTTATFAYQPIQLGLPITCYWFKNTGMQGFISYINEQVQPQIDAVEAEILPISQKLDVARDLFTTR